jgi:hypothetical protein
MSGLKKQYSELTDNELLCMTYFESSDYTEEAIKAAKVILDERGLSNPSNEILQQAKNYQGQIKEAQEEESAKAIRSKGIFGFLKLALGIRNGNYCYLAKYAFWLVVCYGCYSGLNIGSGEGKLVSLFGPIKSEFQFVLEVICFIAVFGTFPVIFFIIYSLKLSPEKRKEQGLSLLMPKPIFIIYGVSLFLFIAPFILSSLWR